MRHRAVGFGRFLDFLQVGFRLLQEPDGPFRQFEIFSHLDRLHTAGEEYGVGRDVLQYPLFVAGAAENEITSRKSRNTERADGGA